MQPWIIEIGIAAASVAAFFGLYGIMRLVSRPARVSPAGATPDLGQETPALASIVGNGWDLTEDAAEATLVDLAAKKVIEFRQPADDPFHKTIHIRQTNPSNLNWYVRRVFERGG